MQPNAGLGGDTYGLIEDLLEHAPTAVCVCDSDGQSAWANALFRELFGTPPTFGPVPQLCNLLVEDPVALLRRALAEETLRLPPRWCDSDDVGGAGGKLGRRAFQVTLVPLRGLDGKAAHVAFWIEDVTAQVEMTSSLEELGRKNEQLSRRLGESDANSNTVLQETEEKFLATFEQAAVGMAHVAPDGQWLEVNERLCQIVGYSRAELLQSTFQNITHVADLNADLEFVRRMLAGDIATYSMEKRYVRKSGTTIWIELTVSLIRHADGSPKYFISVVQDISSRKRTEAALNRTAETLRAEIAERARVEAALRESEASLSATLDSIGDGVVATDTGGRVLHLNPVAEELTGWACGEAIGKLLGEVVQLITEERRGVPGLFEGVLRKRNIPGFDDAILLVARDGTERPIAASGAPIRDAQGSLRGVVLILRDQAQWRKAKNALLASEAQKAAILDAALDCIVSIDAEGVITQFNPAAERTFHYSRAEAVGKPLVQLLIPSALRSEHQLGFRRYWETGAGPILGKRIETQALRRDGTEFPVELAVVPIRSDGRPAFTAFIRDISERHAAAEALQVSEARFKHLADSGIIGIIVADTHGGVPEANDAFLRMVGFTRQEFDTAGLRWTELTPPEWQHLDELAKEQLAATGVAGPWEKEYFRRDGSRVPVLVGVVMLEAPRAIAFVLDLSERRHAEEGRAQAVAVAETESAHRERAEEALRLTEEQLRQSQKMEAVGQLAGSIAHDFNNLLSVVLGYAQMRLFDLPTADPIRADLEQIERAARRGGDLTRQLLAFGRRQVLQPAVVDLNEVLAAMAKMLQRIIGEDIELVVRPAALLPATYVDPGQIEQVLLNLVVNARDAMPTGGRLTIATGEVELDAVRSARLAGLASGQYVTLIVRDTGVGMDEATLVRIFEPFFTTKPKGKGTGLGLSTVYGIVKQSGGSIEAQSEPEQGSVFTVYLPRSKQVAKVPDPPAQSSVPARATETILLVEDDEQVRGLAAAILRRRGYCVLDAETGGDALLISARHKSVIHCLITDVVMPGMSGRELAQRLTATRPGLRTLFMSGYTDEAMASHGVLSADVAFVQKPLTPDVLLAKLRSALDAPGG